MGGLCSRSSSVNNAPAGTFPHANGHLNNGSAGDLRHKDGGDPSPVREEDTVVDKPSSESFSFPTLNISSLGTHPQNIEDGIPRLSRDLSQKSRSTKSRQAAVAKVNKTVT